MIPYPNIDPVAFTIWKLSIRWYGISYVSGFLLGLLEFQYLKRFLNFSISSSDMDKLLFTLVFSVLLGGRLGYILFYNLPYYTHHPLNMLQVYMGGMSFHGALLGILIGLWIYHLWIKKPYLSLLDVIATVAPIGLFFGRIANFINDELWGRPTNVPWGMIFPNGGPIIRHPSQLYESFLEGLVAWIILILTFPRSQKSPGKQGALFLMLYGGFRTFTGFFRAPDSQLGFIFNLGTLDITLGQILSFSMFVSGIIMWFVLHHYYAQRTNITSA